MFRLVVPVEYNTNCEINIRLTSKNKINKLRLVQLSVEYSNQNFGARQVVPEERLLRESTSFHHV